MAIASVVLGAIAITTCMVPIFGLIMGLIALPVAIIALASKKTRGQKTDLKVIGLVLAILSTIIGFVTTAFLLNGIIFVFETVGEMADQITEMPEDERVQEFMADLYEKYIEIVLTNKLSKEDITKEDAYEMYMDVLRKQHRELYNEGYDITVGDELKFEIVPPEAQKM